MASEVSQLSEMNSVLISSKEENERKRNEAAEKAAKISEVTHESPNHVLRLKCPNTVLYRPTH